jgi:hypothetical protein
MCLSIDMPQFAVCGIAVDHGQGEIVKFKKLEVESLVHCFKKSRGGKVRNISFVIVIQNNI